MTETFSEADSKRPGYIPRDSEVQGFGFHKKDGAHTRTFNGWSHKLRTRALGKGYSSDHMAHNTGNDNKKFWIRSVKNEGILYDDEGEAMYDLSEIDNFDRMMRPNELDYALRDILSKHSKTIRNRGYKRVHYHRGKLRYRREFAEGLVYDDGGPGHRKGFSGPPSEHADAMKYWKEHNSNHFILQHFHKHGTANEKMQAAKELPKAESKMKFWERHPNFDRKQAERHTSEMRKQWSSVREETMHEGISDDEYHRLYHSGHDFDRGTGTMRKVKHYEIVRKNRDGEAVVGKAKTRKGAQTAIDKRDNAYGAYVHSKRAVFEESDVREDVNSRGAPKKLRDVLNSKLYMGNTQDEQDILDKRDAETVHHEDRNGNGDDVFNGSAVKVSKTAVNKAGRPEDAAVYEDWNEEVEQVDEVSKGLMARYNDKVQKTHDARAADLAASDPRLPKDGKPGTVMTPDNSKEYWEKHRKATKRLDYARMARTKADIGSKFGQSLGVKVKAKD